MSGNDAHIRRGGRQGQLVHRLVLVLCLSICGRLVQTQQVQYEQPVFSPFTALTPQAELDETTNEWVIEFKALYTNAAGPGSVELLYMVEKENEMRVELHCSSVVCLCAVRVAADQTLGTVKWTFKLEGATAAPWQTLYLERNLLTQVSIQDNDCKLLNVAVEATKANQNGDIFTTALIPLGGSSAVSGAPHYSFDAFESAEPLYLTRERTVGDWHEAVALVLLQPSTNAFSIVVLSIPSHVNCNETVYRDQIEWDKGDDAYRWAQLDGGFALNNAAAMCLVFVNPFLLLAPLLRERISHEYEWMTHILWMGFVPVAVLALGIWTYVVCTVAALALIAFAIATAGFLFELGVLDENRFRLAKPEVFKRTAVTWILLIGHVVVILAVSSVPLQRTS